MKILHWSEMFLPVIGGMEVFVDHLASSLRQRGHQNIILADSFGDKFAASEDWNGLPVRRLPFRAAVENRDMLSMIRLQKQALQVIEEFSPDLIHLHTNLTTAFFYLQAQHAHPRPTLYTCHTTLLDNGGGEVMKGILEQARLVTAVSQAMRENICEYFPMHADKIHVVMNALPAPGINPAPPAFDPPVFLFAGRLLQDKGVETLLRAFAMVHQTDPSARLIYSGDGPEREHLQILTGELGVAESVEFPGWVHPEKLITMMGQASVVVVPSNRKEPFGLVALQGSQAGRPVIASRDGGLPEIVLDGETGLLVEPGDVAALANSMQWLISQPERATSMGRAGRERAEHVFRWQDCVTSFETLYHQVVA